jgi:hypothetical protein
MTVKKPVVSSGSIVNGDAVIYVSSGSELRGFYTNEGLTMPITRRNSTYIVIKYLE